MNLKPISGNFRVLAVLLAASSLTLGACSNNVKQPSSTDGKAIEQEKLAPVKLSFFNGGSTVWPEDQVRTYLEPQLRQKYPHITIDYINGGAKELENLISTGNVPDIVTNGPSSLFSYVDLGITADMTPLVTKHKLDLGRLEDQAVSFIKQHSAKGELLSIPVTKDSNVLYFNKDIFDKFGVAYPKDFMTWDETYELAKKLVREDGGTKYRGFDFQMNTYTTYSQMSLPYVDPKTGKAAINSEGWKSLAEPMQKFYSVNGNEYKSGANQDDYLKNRVLAMYATFNITMLLGDSAGQSFNWDLVTLPTFPNKPKTGSSPFPQHMLVTAQSKYKDDALRVIEVALSDEVQTARGRNAGIGTVLKKKSVQDEFMKGVSFAAGKNVAAFFKLEPAASRQISRYDTQVIPVLQNNVLASVLQGKTDINTALREAEEIANKNIEAEKAKGK